MIQVGVIGTGYIGMVHLDQLVRLGVKVTRIVDSNPDFTKRAALK